MKNPELWVVAKTATGGMEGVRKFWMLDVEFWVNFRLEDRICRKGRIAPKALWRVAGNGWLVKGIISGV